jgi:hypothetical protein
VTNVGHRPQLLSDQETGAPRTKRLGVLLNVTEGEGTVHTSTYPTTHLKM